MLQVELDAAKAVVRRTIDATGYGSFVSDHMCETLAYDVLDVAEKIRRARDAANRAMPPAAKIEKGPT